MKLELLAKMKDWWMTKTSSSYRHAKMLELGEALWKRIDASLPPAEGVTSKDRVRIRMFQRILKELKPQERQALRIWLKHQLRKLQEEFAENTDSQTERYESKFHQIYEQHLEAIISCKV